MASTDELHIRIKGKGGHAALPHKYNSPLLAAAKLITNLDISFSKYRDYPSVLAIGFIEGLGSTNVIPDNVMLKGTFRAMDEDFRRKAHYEMLEIANIISVEYNVKVDFDIRKGYPCLVNDESLTKKSIAFAIASFNFLFALISCLEEPASLGTLIPTDAAKDSIASTKVSRS